MGIAVAKRAGEGPVRTSEHRFWGRVINMMGSRGWILLVLFLLLLVAASIVPDVFTPHDHEAHNLRAPPAGARGLVAGGPAPAGNRQPRPGTSSPA